MKKNISTKKKITSKKSSKISLKELQNQKREEARHTLILEKLPGAFLIVCVLLSLLALFYVLSPFLTVLGLAAVITIAFYPIYKRLVKLFRGHSRIASLLSCLLVVLVIIIPLTIFVILIASEGWSTYQIVSEKINSGVFDQYLQWEDGGFFYDLKQKVAPVVDLDSIDLKGDIIALAKSLSDFLIEQTVNIVTGVSSILLNFFVMLFAMYYFFKDGPKLVQKLAVISPLPSVYEVQLFKKLSSMVKAIILGVFVTAIAQGVLGGIGFAIAGVSNPVFWGAAMAFFSLVPMVGTALIWVPAVIILSVLGNYGSALFVLLWGILLVGSVDNILRPYLIGGKAHTYPLLTFFVVLGGIWVMGFKGVIVGPLILMLLMSFLHIYEAEYSQVLKK